jgi:hypothetical protein
VLNYRNYQISNPRHSGCSKFRPKISLFSLDFPSTYPQQYENFGLITLPTYEKCGDLRPIRIDKDGKKKKQRNLPINGEPNSSESIDKGNGYGQIREYDSDGRAKTDYDFGHDHNGSGDPHAHDWDWSHPQDPRSPARPINLGE